MFFLHMKLFVSNNVYDAIGNEPSSVYERRYIV